MRNYVAEFPGDDSEATQIAQAFPENARLRIGELVRQAGVGRPAEVSERIWLVHDGLYAMAARRGCAQSRMPRSATPDHAAARRRPAEE